MKIYDRWGKQVYQMTSLYQGWGGNMEGKDYYLPIGVYNYTIEGIDTRGKEFTQQGSINLVR